MSIVLKNNAKTLLAANISSVDTNILVDEVDSFPSLGVGDYFYCTIESTTGTYEIVKVTQVNASSFDVIRAQENTIAVPFNIGARVEQRITVQSLHDQFTSSVATEIADYLSNPPVSIGASPAIDSSAPGANGFNVTTTSTATASTPYQFGSQFYFGIAPASTSSTIYRGMYVRSETLTDSDVTEAIGFSSYQYHTGNGSMGTQYGATLQTRLFGSGTVTSAQGALLACRIGSAGGLYNNGRGATASAISDKTGGGIAFNFATGLYCTARITADSVMTDASALEGEILLEASGATMTTARMGYFHGTLAASTSITTLYGTRVSLSNLGSVGNYYAMYIAAPTGNAISSNHYAFYNQSTAWSYSAGNWGFGHDTPSEGTVVIEQGANSAALYTLRTSDDAAGVQWTIDANSSSPAASDVLFTLTAQGRDSGGNATNYAGFTCSILDATNGSEDGRMSFSTMVAGTSAARFRLAQGFFAASTNDQGAGTFNGTGYYVNDTVVITASRGHKLRGYTAAQIADKTHAVNTTDKSTGVIVMDTTNSRIMVAAGATDVSAWFVADASASVTPA